jgi:hypothetical protein
MASTRYTNQINVRLSDDDYQRLLERVEADFTNVSVWVRRAVMKALNDPPPDN